MDMENIMLIHWINYTRPGRFHLIVDSRLGLLYVTLWLFRRRLHYAHVFGESTSACQATSGRASGSALPSEGGVGPHT